METLKTIFQVLLYSAGILLLLALIISIATTPIREAKKKKEIKQLSKEFVDALEKIKEETKEEKPKKTTRKTTKKEEN